MKNVTKIITISVLMVIVFLVTKEGYLADKSNTIDSLFRFMGMGKCSTTMMYDYDVEGTYSVGKTSCTIRWNTSDKAFRIKWKKGSGYTILIPQGDGIFEEYDSSGITYCGIFIFKNSSCLSGTYERADGKKFKVNKID